MVFGLVSSLSKGVMCCASCCIISPKKYEKVKEVKIMKDKLPSPLTIAWCRKNRAIIEEMNAKFDEKKSPSHWNRKGDADYWKTKVAAHRIRAVKLNRLPRWADEQKIEEIIKNCPDGLEIEHEFPLQGRLISGLHVHQNIGYMSAKENASKHNNFNPRRFVINRGSITLL
jgi:hypothetical protein